MVMKNDETQPIRDEFALEFQAEEELNNWRIDQHDLNQYIDDLKRSERFFPGVILEKLEVKDTEKFLENEKNIIQQLNFLEEAVRNNVLYNTPFWQTLNQLGYYKFIKDGNHINLTNSKINTDSIISFDNNTNTFKLNAYLNSHIAKEIEIAMYKPDLEPEKVKAIEHMNFVFNDGVYSKVKSQMRYIYDNDYTCTYRKQDNSSYIHFYNRKSAQKHLFAGDVISIQQRTSMSLTEGVLMGSSTERYGEIIIDGISYNFSDRTSLIEGCENFADVSRDISLFSVSRQNPENWYIKFDHGLKYFTIDCGSSIFDGNFLTEKITKSFYVPQNHTEDITLLLPSILKDNFKIYESERVINPRSFAIEKLFFSSAQTNGLEFTIFLNKDNLHILQPNDSDVVIDRRRDIFSTSSQKAISKILVKSTGGEILLEDSSKDRIDVINHLMNSSNSSILLNNYLVDILFKEGAKLTFKLAPESKAYKYPFTVLGQYNNFFIQDANFYFPKK
jgi:hypothetical protein